jgi:hypothetical protein
MGRINPQPLSAPPAAPPGFPPIAYAIDINLSPSFIVQKFIFKF